ncbi:MAG: FAD-dependent monooxygenase [Pseudonocardiales bacterium]|nr:FAD-dependent monooxygenase [Pseudonocardiales bacterium]
MTENRYDVIVVGARCAGSPTAMLLARAGYRVLSVDRATFPSDTISTHLVHPPGVAALRRWGLLDRLKATGCPPIDTYLFDFGPFTIAGAPGTDDAPVAYGPRRTVLDKLLVDAEAEAGVEVREGFTVSSVVFDDDGVIGLRGRSRNGPTVTERARVVVDADGWHSRVAQSVRPKQYHDKPRLLCGYYTYYSGLPMGGSFETYPPRSGIRGVGYERRPDAGRRRLAVRRVRGQQERHRGQLPQDVGTGAALRRTGPGGQPRGSFRRHSRTEFLPQALRSGLGTGRRCRVQQGLHHRAGNHRRLPGR